MNYKKVFIFVSILTLTVIVGMVAKQYQEEKICTDVLVEFEKGTYPPLLDEQDIKQILQTPLLLGEPYYKINIQKLEQQLRKNPFIEQAEVFFRPDNALAVKVKLKQVLARVITQDGQQFYLDPDGYKVPISNHFTPRVILIRGNISEPPKYKKIQSHTLKSLFPLVKYISQHSRFSLLFSELIISEDEKLSICPELGNFVIEFGDIENYETKLNSLWAFYQNVLPKVGWNYYQSISLAYNNQIVGRRKNS